MQNNTQPTSLEDVKAFAEGTWKSISIELRPTEDRAGVGQILPTRLTRTFRFLGDDLIYFRNGMLFMGAKHVDGTPFDKPDRRPHQLQIPLIRVDR